jgi:hypothetical protein
MVIGRKGSAAIVLSMMLAWSVNARSQEQAPAAKQAEAAPVPQKTAAPAKGKKAVYTGPNNVIELPPTPILDEEGKQRLDPDGKPMFNPPVMQQRDKHGHPLFDKDGKPVMQTAKDMGYDANGKKIPVKKEKPPKTINVSIAHGTLTVDGMIGKAALNYEIHDLKYIYFYAPWVGVVVVSNVPFPSSTPQPNAFNDKTLTVAVGEHTFQLYSDKQLLGKKPETAFVLVDRNFQLPTQMPVMGYGAMLKAPYAWPGAKLVASTKYAPPVPVELRPTLLLPPCPAGQMRMPGPPVLPGETRDDPCVPIGTAEKAMSSGPATAAPAKTTTAPAKPDAPAAPPPAN